MILAILLAGSITASMLANGDVWWQTDEELPPLGARWTFASPTDTVSVEAIDAGPYTQPPYPLWHDIGERTLLHAASWISMLRPPWPQATATHDSTVGYWVTFTSPDSNVTALFHVRDWP